jgi:hypothetical protein
MKQSLGYLLAAALFALATGLNYFRVGLNLMTGIGLVFVVVMVAMAISARRGAG